MLERHYGGEGSYFILKGRVRECHSKEGTLEWNLNDMELAKGGCGVSMFWTEIKTKNALIVGCQI